MLQQQPWRNEAVVWAHHHGEDPVGLCAPPKLRVVTQREVGLDTDGWEAALKRTLTGAVILMGEVRDRETMEHAIAFAETVPVPCAPCANSVTGRWTGS
jgi:twitching motility protein PilU